MLCVCGNAGLSSCGSYRFLGPRQVICAVVSSPQASTGVTTIAESERAIILSITERARWGSNTKHCKSWASFRVNVWQQRCLDCYNRVLVQPASFLARDGMYLSIWVAPTLVPVDVMTGHFSCWKILLVNPEICCVCVIRLLPSSTACLFRYTTNQPSCKSVPRLEALYRMMILNCYYDVNSKSCAQISPCRVSW